jgi:GT2 family glycosyltransferase
MLALESVGEVIVVNDGSTDDTLAVCEAFEDERLQIISHRHNRGVAGARSTGVAAASGSWVLFGEDDCRFPANYATVLLADAKRHGADIVGAPLVYPPGKENDVAEYVAHLTRTSDTPSIEVTNVFPACTIETPFLPACALVRQTVFEHAQFYEGYPGNGYREETDFFVQAARCGFRCLLSAETYFYQLDSYSGGQHHSSPLRYEFWAFRNNWRFLRRHGSWLESEGHIDGLIRAQLRFAQYRAKMVGGGFLGARLEQFGGVRNKSRRAPSAS